MSDTTHPTAADAVTPLPVGGDVPPAVVQQATGSAFRPARIGWVDVARGIGMVLVITGHAVPKGVPPPVAFGRWIYSFHIPLFFFISGALMREDAPRVPWRQFASKSARALMLPYAVFGAFSYVAWLLVLRHFGNHATMVVPLWYPLWGLVYGTFDAGLGILNAPIWFFPCLFCTLMLHRGLPQGFTARIVAVPLIFAAGVAFVEWSPHRLPWGMDLACLGLLFLYAGQVSRPWLLGMTPATRLWCLLLLPLFAALQYFCVEMNARVDLARGLIGNPGLFLIGAFSGTLATFLIAPYLSERGLLGFIGRNTIIIFPLHLFCFSVVALLMAAVPRFRRFMELSPFVTIGVYVVFTCLAFLPIVPLVKKLLPWLAPAPKPRPAA